MHEDKFRPRVKEYNYINEFYAEDVLDLTDDDISGTKIAYGFMYCVKLMIEKHCSNGNKTD